MELLKTTDRFVPFKEDKSLFSPVVDYMGKFLRWIEDNIYAEIVKRVNWNTSRLNKGDGISGTFTTVDGKTITIENGIVSSIV